MRSSPQHTVELPSKAAVMLLCRQIVSAVSTYTFHHSTISTITAFPWVVSPWSNHPRPLGAWGVYMDLEWTREGAKTPGTIPQQDGSLHCHYYGFGGSDSLAHARQQDLQRSAAKRIGWSGRTHLWKAWGSLAPASNWIRPDIVATAVAALRNISRGAKVKDCREMPPARRPISATTQS
ncbi:hypothetical protein CC78DRAFT_337092 [Lojkania enalia]|uniref:Uncharacterized protein n=1 Tax=Lojkania enalia TaxID=147567 RepID=A0A9P4N111_9PLEO|nr:hypothetical protein CC78DRAFT_337092 [Didymosphaeria enalia]